MTTRIIFRIRNRKRYENSDASLDKIAVDQNKRTMECVVSTPYLFIHYSFTYRSLSILAINPGWGNDGGYKKHWPDILSNLNASIFDLAVLIFLINLLTSLQDKRRNIKKWEEEIDDYRGWNEPEAMYRNVGNIIRLLRNKARYLNLHKCYLKGATLDSTNLKGAYLALADLSAASLRSSNLSSAELWNANLTGANLFYADLSNTNLHKTNLSNADLTNTILNGANLSESILTGAQVKAEQLLQAKTLYKAAINMPLLIQIKNQKPELLALEYTDFNKKWNMNSALLEEIKKPDWNGWKD